MTKKCKECGAEKPLAEFYKDRHMADGLFAKCRSCVCAASARWQQMKRATDPNWVMQQRERARNKKRTAPQRRSREANLEWKRRNQHKVRAQQAAYRAVRDGKITPPDKCDRCFRVGPVEKHHPDYAEPLRIIFLCKTCHGLEHRKPAPPIVA